MNETCAERSLRILFWFLFVAVVIAIFPLTPEPSGDIKILVYQLLAFVLLAVWFFQGSALRTPLQWRHPLTLVLAVFLALNLVASLGSLNAGYSLLGEFAKLASLFAIFLAATAAFKTEKHVWNFATVACVAVALASIYGFFQAAGLDPFPWGNDEGLLRSAPATFGNPNYASHTLAPTLILAAGLALQPRRRWAVLLIILTAVHFSLTKTRGSLLGVGAAVALAGTALLIARTRTSPLRGTVITLGLLLLITAGAVTAVGSYTRITSGRFYPYGAGDTIASRYHSFYGACRLAQEKPFLGHGPGMYRAVNVKYWTPFEKEIFKQKNDMNFHVHNEPLEIAVDAGIPAAVAYLAVLIMAICYGLWLWYSSGGWALRSLGLTLASFYTCFLVDGLFGFNFHVPVSALLLFIVLGATVGVLKHREGSFSVSRRQWLLTVPVLIVAGLFAGLGVCRFTAQFFHQHGRGAYDLEFYTTAAECYEKAAALAPNDWTHWHWLGLSERKLGNTDSAAASFRRALRLNPFQYHTYVLLSEALLVSATSSLEKTTLQEAESCAKTAIQINALLPEPYEILGQAKLLEAQLPNGEPAQALQEAENHLRKAIECGSKNEYKIYRTLAEIQFAAEDVPGAQKDLVKSLEEKSDELASWELFLRTSEKTGDYRALLASLNRRLPHLENTEAPDSVLVELGILHSAVLLDGFHDEPAATEVLLQLAKQYPQETNVWSQLYAFCESTGREEVFSKAITTIDKAVSVPPVVHAVARAYIGEADAYTASVAEFSQALEQEQTGKSDTETLRKKFGWAAKVLAKRVDQLNLPPEKKGDACLKLGMAYGAWKDFTEAADLLGRAWPHLPRDQAVLCLLRQGSALAMTRNADAAVEALEKAKRMAPNNFDVRYALADTLLQAGKPLQAEAEFRGILRDFQLTEKGVSLVESRLENISVETPGSSGAEAQ